MEGGPDIKGGTWAFEFMEGSGGRSWRPSYPSAPLPYA